MELNPRVVLQELAHQGGFVSRQIVQDDVNLLVPGAQRKDFLEQGDKLASGVAGGGFAVNPRRARVQGCIQGQCSMAVVLKSVALGTSGERGSTGSRRSSAWMAVFSSTQNTAACRGGLRYKPMISAVLDSKSGSLLAM